MEMGKNLGRESNFEEEEYTRIIPLSTAPTGMDIKLTHLFIFEKFYILNRKNVIHLISYK